MLLPKLERGCCGSTLRTGALIIAWLNMIFTVLVVVLFIVLSVLLLLNPPQDKEYSSETKKAADIGAIVFGIVLVLLLVTFLIVLGLLVGIYKRNACLMLPYIILSGIGNFLNIIQVVVVLVFAFMNPVLFLAFLLQIMITALYCYLWLIVYSHYLEIKEGATLGDENDDQ